MRGPVMAISKLRLPDALPSLSGRALLSFRLVWTALFLLALVAPVAGLYMSDRDNRLQFEPFREFGLRSTDAEGKLNQPFGDEAKRQGVVRNATLVAINGRSVRGDATRTEIASLLSSAPGPKISLVTRTPDGESRSHRLTRDPQLWAENYRGSGISRTQRQWIARILSVLTAVIAIAAALLLALRRPRDPVAALFSLGLLAQAASANAAVAMWSSLGAIDVGAVLFFGSVALFSLGVLVFPHGRFEPRWTRFVLMPLLMWMVIRWVEQFVKWVPPIIENITSISFFLLCLSALLVRFQRVAPGAERQQIRWALFGFAGFAVCGIVLTNGARDLGQERQ